MDDEPEIAEEAGNPVEQPEPPEPDPSDPVLAAERLRAELAETQNRYHQQLQAARTAQAREAETQTLHAVSTNTERTVSYVSGVRGVPEPFVEAAARNRAVGKSALPSSKSRAPERMGPVAVKVDNVIDECQDPGAFRVAVARVDGGAQTAE